MTEIPKDDAAAQADQDDFGLMSRGNFLKLAAASAGALLMPNVAKAAATAMDKKGPPLSSGEREWLHNVGGIVNEINHTKEPNIFYGAIMVPVTHGSGAHPLEVMHVEIKKDERLRGSASATGPLVLVNPVIYEGVDGRPYAVGFDRGDPTKPYYGIEGRMNFSNYNEAAQTANTTDIKVVSRNRFIDLGEVFKLNGTLICFSEGPHNKPVMVKQKIVDGIRTVSDMNEYPVTSEVEGMWFDFPGGGTQALQYMNQMGFKMMHSSYKPPFYDKAVKAAKQITW